MNLVSKKRSFDVFSISPPIVDLSHCSKKPRPGLFEPKELKETFDTSAWPSQLILKYNSNNNECKKDEIKIVATNSYARLRIQIKEIKVKVQFSNSSKVSSMKFNPHDIVDRNAVATYGASARQHKALIEASNPEMYPLQIQSPSKYRGMTCCFISFIYGVKVLNAWCKFQKKFVPIVHSTAQSCAYVEPSDMIDDIEPTNFPEALLKRFNKGLKRKAAQFASTAPPPLPLPHPRGGGSGSGTVPKWFFENGNVKEEYEPLCANIVEKAYQAGDPITEYIMHGKTYKVIFRDYNGDELKDMFQWSKGTGTKRRIFRDFVDLKTIIEKTIEDSEVKHFPPVMHDFLELKIKWRVSFNTPFFHPIEPSSKHWLIATEKFLLTANVSRRITIHKVYAYVNPLLWSRFTGFEDQQRIKETRRPCSRISSMDGKMFVNRCLLFHGTDAKTADTILEHGFVKEYNTKKMFGEGNYFAENSAYSADFAKPSIDGLRTMIVTDVIVGRTCSIARNDLNKLGKIILGSTIPNDRAETFVDDEERPRIYCCTDNAQAYPSYKIIFSQY
jgi:hypothetical protein